MSFFEEEESGKNLSEIITRFEKMIENRQSGYFDSDEICDVIDYYFQWLNLSMATKAIAYGENNFPNDEEILIRKVRLLCYEGNTREALKILNDMEQLYPDFAELYIERAHIYIQMALAEQALENYKKSLALSEQKDDIYFYMGSACTQIHRWEDAAFYFKKALMLNPDFEEALYPFCDAMIHLSRTEECITMLNKILDQRPFSFTAWFCMAQLYLYKEKYEEALDCLEYADAVEPEQPEAELLKCRCLLELKREEQAIKILTSLLSKEEISGQKGEILYLLGEAHEKKEDYQKALVYYNKSIQAEPSVADSWIGIGSVLMQLNRNLEARHYFTKAVELEPHEPECWNWLAECLASCGLMEESFQAYIRSLELDSGQQEVWKEFLLLLIQNQYDNEAEENIIQAIKNFPDDSDFYFMYSAFLFKKGKTQKSLEYLDKGMILNPKNFEYLFLVNPDLLNTEIILNRIRRA
jgi:tetratricopeptide (TPR) repeat protein